MGSEALRVSRELAAGIDPVAKAAQVGARFEGTPSKGELEFGFLGSPVAVTWPDLECRAAQPLPPHVEALLLYYIALSDGTQPSGRWVSFASLPDGAFYVSAFRGYTGNALVRAYASNPDLLGDAVTMVGGTSMPGVADRAWRVPALPRVPVALLWWDGDDEFEPRAELLFDDTVPHHLSIDGCAVLGSWLTATLSRLGIGSS